MILIELQVFIPAVFVAVGAASHLKRLISPSEPKVFQFKKGNMYLIKGRDVERSYALFASEVDKSTGSLLITRKKPSQVQAAYSLNEVPTLWLSQKEEENVLYPTQLHKLVYLISETVFNKKGSVILLDGLEYLVVHNKFDQVLKHLYIIREVVCKHGGILLIPLDPEAFSEKEMGFLEKESIPLDPI